MVNGLKKLPLFGIVHRFHNDPVSIAHVDLMQDNAWSYVGSNWDTCHRVMLVPALGSMWAENGTLGSTACLQVL